MQFLGWMMDIAREQSPSEEWLLEVLHRSKSAGYGALGLYLEHRFQYRAAPWAAASGALSPEVARRVSQAGKESGVRVIPFLNTLGHMEGFIRSEGGQWLAEGPSAGSQSMCPSRPECVDFAKQLISEAMEAFDDEWVHIGGDETNQLGQCPLCAKRAESIGKDGIYAAHYMELCNFVLSKGRRPCLWADMLITYPSILDSLPRETILFDWHYAESPRESTRIFREKGFDVVCCPAVRTYDSHFCHLEETEKWCDEHAKVAQETNSLGVLVTTWEFSFFTNYASTMPIIYSAGRRLRNGEDWDSALIAEGGEEYAKMANLIGRKAQEISPFLRAPGWRRLRDALVIRQNPFYLWQDWRDEACGEIGEQLLTLCKDVKLLSDEWHIRYPARILESSILWVRDVEGVYQRYRTNAFPYAPEPLEKLFERRFGSPVFASISDDLSQGDVNRHGRLTDAARAVGSRIRIHEQALKLFGHSWKPAFETLIHDAYVVGDQAAWRTGQYR